MISLFLPLLLSVNTADAARVRVIFRGNHRTHHSCQHRHVYKHNHYHRPPVHRSGGDWVWVFKHRVKHDRHSHWVPGHWEFREHKRR